jgi:predicted DNA-binding WGR domain protein
MNRSSWIDSPNLLDVTRLHGDSAIMQMTTQHECQLRRIDPARNMARFYLVSVGRSLFGDFSVVREWGRIGTIGRVRVDLFENEHAALGALDAIERAKRKRGYWHVEVLMSDGRCS